VDYAKAGEVNGEIFESGPSFRLGLNSTFDTSRQYSQAPSTGK
jgi:hypothetical protein